MKLLPSITRDRSVPAVTSQELVDYYGDDLPSILSLQAELDLWKHKWESQSHNPCMPDSPSKSLLVASKNFFPNIHAILRLVCTVPVTSCECERSVSVLRRVKTYLRSTMSQDRLSGSALMHTHYGMNIDYEEIINIFARRHPRRMQLLNVLDDSSLD